ncbi:MAG TPA: DUF1697 domain-containing protein [Candidatus Cybelea sp.]|nr:DUF1697 domain-containing protein [Candidatus Cybelea sp.]
MAVFVALLRGVNVGQNTLRMERVREICVELRLRNARTYLQSGNVVFDAGGTAAKWAQALEKNLAGETRLPVTVIVRTQAEISSILAGNPFLAEKGIDPKRLHVTFLEQSPEPGAVAALAGIKAGPDRFVWLGTEIYLHCPEGYGTSKLSNAAIERLLAVRATTRNWATVTKLHAMPGR